MNRTANKQTGFSIIEAVIAIVIVGAAVTTGVIVYQHNQTKVTDAAPNTNNPPSQQVTTTPYLSIKEWAVKLPLSSNVKDAYYVVATNSTDTMWLGLTSLDSTGCAAARGNTDGASAPIAALIRVLPTDHEPVSGKLYTDLYPGMTVGNYYYALLDGTKSKTCTSATSLQSISSALTTAAKSTVSAAAN